MFVIIGLVVVLASVVIGFTVAGGNVVLLIQISEFITIGGAAIGSILVASPLSLIKKMATMIPEIFKHSKNSKEDYMQMLKSFSDLFLIAQREGLLTIEKHIEDPDKSEILSRSKKFIEDTNR
ncbi:MAG: motility-associated protein, partial [Bacteroidota bacterium]